MMGYAVIICYQNMHFMKAFHFKEGEIFTIKMHLARTGISR